MRGHVTLSAALLLAAVGTASSQNNVIHGKVRSSNGLPLNNAIVELRRGGGGMLAQTVTRNDGDFAFSALDYAEYEVAVALAGYEPAVELVRFKLPPGMSTIEVLNVEIQLRPKPDALLAPPGVSFAQEVPKPARSAYEKGIAKIREGKTDEGIALLREATTIFKDYFNAYFQLGSELYHSGQFEQALVALERARQINDRESAVYHLFGLIMVKQQKFAVAEYAFREATRLDISSVPSHFWRALALIELGFRGADEKQRAADLTEAENELNRAWELSERKLPAVYLHLSRIHQRRGDKEAAARDLEAYLKAEPGAKNAAAIREAIATLRTDKK